MPAQLAIVATSIRTMDPDLPFTTAIAVEDGIITALGDDVAAAIDGTTEVIDGSGWTVTPGIVDGHQHLFMGARVGRGICFDRVDTLDNVRALLAAERKRVGPGEWVLGYAFEYGALQGADYHHELIDSAAGDGPMLIYTLDMHTGLANAHALREANITGARRFADGSIIVCDDAGLPTGELREMSAITLVLDQFSEVVDEDSLAWYEEAMAAQNAVGITAVHQMDASLATTQTLSALEQRGTLSLRVNVHYWVDARTDDATRAELVASRDLKGRRWRADGTKFMIDGVIDTGTAWLEEPDTHGDGLESMWPDIVAYRKAVAQFADAGFAVTTHAIGDRAIREVLDTYAGLKPGHRAPRIEHIEAAPDATVARFAPEGVIASMQPIHLRWLAPDMTDPWSQRLGRPRCEHVMPSGDLQAAGALVVLGSDWPVAPFDPRMGFVAAQERRGSDRPEHSAIGTSRPLNGLQTLAGYTMNSAIASGEQAVSGSLTVGKRADLVAWGADPVTCSTKDVGELPVHLTVVDGTVVHRGNG